MIFNFYVGVSDLKNKESKDDKGKDYAICIGDTVLVNDADTPATILTSGKKKSKNVSIFLKDESGSSDDEGTGMFYSIDTLSLKYFLMKFLTPCFSTVT